MTTDTTREPSRTARRVIVRALTEILAPSVIVVVLPLVVAWQATGSLAATLLWGLTVAVTSSVLPMVVIVRGSRAGRWDGHHVRDREGRLVPFLVLVVLSLLGLALLIAGHAPGALIALHISMVVSLLVTGAITAWWKVSMHAAVAAGAMVVLVVLLGPVWWLAAPLVAAVAWSRVEVGDHTPAQVAVGAMVGAVVGGGSFAGMV